jgi:hypothetical protein
MSKILDPEIAAELDALEERIRGHAAMRELADFGQLLAARPLDPAGLKTFFATMGAFFRNIPTGIMALALRVCDEEIARDRYNATSVGAYLLFADVDEFGLQDLRSGLQPTHHQLFRELTHHLQVSDADMDDRRFALPAGRNLGALSAEYYRNRTVAEGLGFHLSSEETSAREFTLFLRGFVEFKSTYGFQDADDPKLAFFKIHTLVEPQHKHLARSLIEHHLRRDPALLPGIEQGAMAFLDGFEDLFRSLREALA